MVLLIISYISFRLPSHFLLFDCESGGGKVGGGVDAGNCDVVGHGGTDSDEFDGTVEPLPSCNYYYCFINYRSQILNKNGKKSPPVRMAFSSFLETRFYDALTQNNLNIAQPQPITSNGPNLPYVIIGDSAFALSENIMKPYPGINNRGTIRRIYNYRLSRSRRIVKMCMAC